MNRLTWIVAAVALALIGAWLVTRPGATLPMQAESSELAVYAVPADRAMEIDTAIQQVLTAGKKPLGASHLAGPDRLLVLAPPSIHDGIKNALKDLGASNVPGRDHKQALSLSVWLLQSNASSIIDPALASVGAQTDALKKALGVASFKLVDQGQMALATNADMAELGTPRGTQVRARVLADGPNYVLDFRLSKRDTNLSGVMTKTTVVPGQNLVLSTVAGAEPGQWDVVILRLDQPEA